MIKKCVAIGLCLLAFLVTGRPYSASTQGIDPTTEFQEAYLEAMTKSDKHERYKELKNLLIGSTSYERFFLLPAVAKAAFNVENYLQAKKHAEELLTLREQYRDDWHYGNAVHDGHLVLGMISLESGDIEAAKEHLIAAGKTRGSPQLNSFGPSMALAKALLQFGEEEVVIEYLLLCKGFWGNEGGRIDSWIAAIETGGEPYFGENLSF